MFEPDDPEPPRPRVLFLADGRCVLCPRCTAYNDGCLVMINRYVPHELCALFDGRRERWQPTAGQ